MSESILLSEFPSWLGDSLGLLLADPCSATDLGDEVAFEWGMCPPISIIFEKARIPNSHDLDFIAMILRDQSVYVDEAAELLLQDLKSRAVGKTDVSDPRLTFRLDDTWEVHFQNAIPEETEGLGVLIYFTGEHPQSVEILGSGFWFDSDTGEWVPA